SAEPPRSLTTTLAPSAAASMAISLPMPRPAPVTTTTFPSTHLAFTRDPPEFLPSLPACQASSLVLFPPRHECEALEQMHVLLVLEQCAMQRRDQLPRIVLAQHLRRDVLVEQELQPVEQLRRGGLLLEAGHLAHVEEDLHRLADEPALET